MAKKTTPDKSEKILEDYADVFADIINVIVYDGAKVVKKENLLDGPTASIYKTAEGNYGQKERDVCKIDTQNGVAYVLYGLENQTKTSNIMPVRCMGYDYSAYDKNIKIIKDQNKSKKHEADYAAEIWPEQRIFPAVTIVLYFGSEQWKGPLSLHDMMDLPENLKSYVPNYHINLVQVAYLPEDVIAKFQSDFQIVAEYFRAKRLGIEEKKSYNEKKWVHVAELMEFFHTFMKDRRYEKQKQYMVEAAQKGEVSMCTLLDSMLEQRLEERVEEKTAEVLAEGKIKGKIEGKIEGKAEARYEAVNQLQKNGFSKEKAMECLDFTAEEAAGYERWKEI